MDLGVTGAAEKLGDRTTRVSASLAFSFRRRLSAAAAAMAVLFAMLVVVAASRTVRVVVTSFSDREAGVAVERAGGSITSSLPLIDGVVADVPSDRLPSLRSDATVVVERALHVRSASFGGDPTTVYPQEVGATDVWPETTGEGVGVALVDTGVAPVPDVLERVVAVADLTAEHRFGDGFGHGTFMAGLIAGTGASSDGAYTGVAPGAHLVSIKVALSDGSTTLSTVLEALQLVDSSRQRFNLRVLLLALSSDSDLAPDRDPLTRGLRKLWDHGVFVVVAAGNDGPGPGSVDLPGNDPVLFTAGAIEDMRTPDVSDDEVPSWTSRGPSRFGAAKPDVAAPGVHLVSVRAPGSLIDRENPAARVGEDYFLGSGTSMSAAVTAGVAALVLSARPDLPPDGVKAVLADGATQLEGADDSAVGAGVVDAAGAIDSSADGNGHNPHGHGKGPHNTVGNHWNGRIWIGRIWNGRIWNGRIWNGRLWNGENWDEVSWDGRLWNGRLWNGRLWNGRLWNGRLWNGRLWNGRVWSSRIWG
jgi:serine protease AprX